MADNKFLWRATVLGIAKPIYIVAQNIQSAQAEAASDPQVAPEHVVHLALIDLWDPVHNRTHVSWPEPPPPPHPEEPPQP